MLTSKPKFINIIISLSLLLLIVNTALSNSSNCIYTWSAQNSGTTNLLQSVKAVNNVICWAAGNNGTVLRTTNQGLTWMNANPNPGIIAGNVVNIEALDADNAWATSRLTNMVSYIYRTTNGGNNWMQVYSVSQIFLHGVHMNSLTDGFAFGDPLSMKWNILTTTNGGLNWSQLPTAPAAQPPAQGFAKSFHVSMPNIWFSSYPATIIRSTNGGINWSEHLVPGNGMSTIFSIHFNSSSIGFVSSVNMAKSTDAGNSYFQSTAPGLGNINAIEGSGNEYWYVRGQYIYHSTNSGEHWTQVHNNGITLSDIDIPDNMSGCLTAWAVGYGGTVINMSSEITGIANYNSEPKEYRLEQNYPNPFNPTTVIRYSIPDAGQVKISLYDITGKVLKVIVDEYKTAGIYNINFDASEYSAGLYIYRIETDEFIDSKKLILLK